MIAALEAARVTIRTQHPEVRLRWSSRGTRDNQKGHAAADMAGVPDMLGCPGPELADEQTPALRRPAKRGPARTRCSAHLRPVEHATNRQRVIGDREPAGWMPCLTLRDQTRFMKRAWPRTRVWPIGTRRWMTLRGAR